MNKFIKKTLLYLGLSSLLGVILYANEKEKMQSVAISQIVQHPALDATRRGILDQLEEEGFIDGKNIHIIFETAQGSPLLASQISQKFVGMDVDVMVGIGTTSAQTMKAAVQDKNIPIIFSSVTDPIEAQLVKNLSNPEGNTSGVSNWIDMKPQLKLFQEILPKMKRIGVVYNPGEANSESLLKVIREAGKSLNIEMLTANASDSAEVGQAASSLIGKVDALFISNDNTALSAFESVVKAGNKGNIPVFVSDVDMTERGAVAALGPNQYSLGKQTGKMVARVLRGEDLSEIPIEFPKDSELYINSDAASKINLTIPQKVLEKAKSILSKKTK